MSVTTGMIGKGFYDRNSAPQWQAIEAILPWLGAAAESLPLDDDAPALTIADFGCSEGQNSLEVMRHLVPHLRARTDRPVLTVHSDLPTNDFSGLLARLQPGEAPAIGTGVYSALVAGSMFDQLLPPATTHLAMTFNAIGFLSRRPLDKLPGYILPNGPSAVRGIGCVTAEELAVLAAQANADLEAFLRARAAELVPGGRLLVEVFGVSADGRTCDGIYDALNDAVLEVLDAGLIDRAGYETFYQPVYLRSLDELIAPVRNAEASCGQLFTLDDARTYEVAVPFVETFRRTGDLATYARRYTDFFRAFTEPVLQAAFAADDPQELADGVYERAERLVREHPERYPFRYFSVAALLTRRPGGPTTS